MNGVFTQSEGSDALVTAWEDSRKSLNALSAVLRSMKGFDQVAIGICMRNGSRLEIYSVPGGLPLRVITPPVCSEQEVNERNRTGEGTALEDPTGQQLENTPLDILCRLSTKDFRYLFTSIRKSLRLNNFDWPQKAKQRFMEISRDPVPCGPGRAHSGRDNLILMLRLSAEVDEAWKCSVMRNLSLMFHTSVIEDGAGQNDNRRNETFTADGRRIHQQDGSQGSNVEEWLEQVSVIMEQARKLPRDEMKVTVARCDWVSLSVLMGRLMYPGVNDSCAWYIQRTPADGNCMFSALMTTANVRGLLPNSLGSVASLRAILKLCLKQISNAGFPNSSFRREWLASCMYGIDDKGFQSACSSGLERAMRSGSENDIETFLKPLRMYVSNWADMVGGVHWGGLLRVELGIFATITNTVIEVLRKVRHVENGAGGSDEHLLCCDTRIGGTMVTCKRVDLVFPTRSHLPCVKDMFVAPCSEAGVRGGWIGNYPVVRVVLNDRHYSACTSKYRYPIPPGVVNRTNRPWFEWFNHSDTLVNAYSSLDSEEEEHYQKARTLIEDWHHASSISAEAAKHADTLVMHSKDAELSVSMLSHLEMPPSASSAERYMLSDEVVTSYMRLLENRSNDLIGDAKKVGLDGPPRCRYMDSWFYKALHRGPTGPSSRRKRMDLSPFSMIIIPALVEGHWLLAVCFVEDRVIGVFDPLQKRREDVFQVVKRWVQVQVSDREDDQWAFLELKESRGCVQVGTVDCGVYVCKAAESVGLGIPIRVSHWDVPYVRKRMMMELFRQVATAVRWPRRQLIPT